MRARESAHVCAPNSSAVLLCYIVYGEAKLFFGNGNGSRRKHFTALEISQHIFGGLVRSIEKRLEPTASL